MNGNKKLESSFYTFMLNEGMDRLEKCLTSKDIDEIQGLLLTCWLNGAYIQNRINKGII